MAKTQYHAVMLGECHEEFGVTFNASNREAAYKYLRDNYPESKVDELRTVAEWHRREKRLLRRAEEAYWNDGDSFNYDNHYDY